MANKLRTSALARARYNRTIAHTALLRAQAQVQEAERRLAEAEAELARIETEGGVN